MQTNIYKFMIIVKGFCMLASMCNIISAEQTNPHKDNSTGEANLDRVTDKDFCNLDYSETICVVPYSDNYLGYNTSLHCICKKNTNCICKGYICIKESNGKLKMCITLAVLVIINVMLTIFCYCRCPPNHKKTIHKKYFDNTNNDGLDVHSSIANPTYGFQQRESTHIYQETSTIVNNMNQDEVHIHGSNSNKKDMKTFNSSPSIEDEHLYEEIKSANLKDPDDYDHLDFTLPTCSRRSRFSHKYFHVHIGKTKVGGLKIK